MLEVGCMRFNKKNIIVLIVVILFALLLFLPNVIGLIPSDRVKFVIYNIFSLLVFLFLIYITYNDIRERKFTTTVYIVLADIIVMAVFAAVMYTFYNYFNVTNVDILLRESRIRVTSLIFLFCSSILLNYLKSDKFKKN